MINRTKGEKSIPELFDGMIARIGDSRGSVTWKIKLVKLFFAEYGNHDRRTLASKI